MKKMIFTAIFAVLLLSGCTQANGEKMTQSIQSSSLAQSAQSQSAVSSESSSAAQSMASSSAQSTASSSESAVSSSRSSTLSDVVTGDAATDEEYYYRNKAEQEAIDVEIDNLEAKYRIGELDRDTFIVQKQELELQENVLEAEEELLEDVVDMNYRMNRTLPEGTLEQLLEQLRQVETDGRALEVEENTLKQDYRAGNITREDFVTKMVEIVRQEEALDRQEDALEDALERMGWDD